MDNYVGEIRVFPSNNIPRGWVSCEGQTMQINQNQALYALLGTYYGGDGKTTFLLPDLRGRIIMGAGMSTSGVAYGIGKAAGSEGITLSIGQMPYHTHSMNAANINGSVVLNATAPAETLAKPVITGLVGSNINAYISASTNVTTITPETISASGDAAPHENRVPVLAMKMCIAVTGLFPSRS